MEKSIYERKETFYLCHFTNSTNNSNIFVADIFNPEDTHFMKWAWILILLNLTQLVLYALQARDKVNIFGSSVNGHDFISGPKPPAFESNSNDDVQGNTKARKK